MHKRPGSVRGATAAPQLVATSPGVRSNGDLSIERGCDILVLVHPWIPGGLPYARQKTPPEKGSPSEWP